MKWIDYANPRTVDDAVRLLSEAGGKARVLAGGTDLLSQLRSGRRTPDLVVDCKAIPELNVLSFDRKAGLTLGAAVPCYRVYGDAAVQANYPALVDSASIIGGVQIQGRASIGGNLCNATPSADAIPTLIVLGVSCTVVGPRGTRTVPVEAFCTGPGTTVLQPDELLVSLRFPLPASHQGAHYLRFTPRNEMDIAVAGAGVSVTLSNGRIESARIALSAVAPTPLLVAEAGAFLSNREATEDNVRAAANLARGAARPITDMRGTAEYRRHLCEVLTRRALKVAIDRAKETR